MNPLQEKLKKINPKHLTIMAFALPVAVLVAYVYFVYQPYTKRIDDLNARIQKNESEISQSQVMQRKLKELKAANQKLQEQLKAATVQLPNTEQSSKLPDQVQDMIKSVGLTYKSITPGLSVPGPDGLYQETPMVVELSGSYHDAGKFMEGIDKITQLITVSELTMSSAKMEGNKMNIPVKFTLLAFTAGGGK